MISAHFARSESACKCGCGFATVDVESITVLEDLRHFFDRPVNIQSGCRCPVYNLRINGAKKSYHLVGQAHDITITQCPPDMVARYLDKKYPDKYGIGNYLNFTHIDVRPIKARWQGHNYNV